MTVYITNKSKQIVILNIDNGENINLQPFETTQINQKNSNIMKLLIKRNCKSHTTKSIMCERMYHLIIESEYLISKINDGDKLFITREKLRFNLNVFYDRLFLLVPKNSSYLETHRVLNEEKMKKIFKKSRLIELFIVNSLEAIELFIVLILIGIVLSFLWGWKFAVIYFPIAYLSLVLLNLLIDKFLCVIGKKAFKAEDEKTEFYNCFENDFIRNYYSDLNRTPFMGEIETD